MKRKESRVREVSDLNSRNSPIRQILELSLPKREAQGMRLMNWIKAPISHYKRREAALKNAARGIRFLIRIRSANS
ncbi:MULTISPECIES: hypothetical protein, partial [unclassified Streptomyces]|uniref:hypothetical protein n=1 Tax=unclassified Streptomyces TaxID=2593676 RepID=UPI0022515480